MVYIMLCGSSGFVGELLWKWGVKRIIHTPSPNILEGNGVVFGNFTFNNL